MFVFTEENRNEWDSLYLKIKESLLAGYGIAFDLSKLNAQSVKEVQIKINDIYVGGIRRSSVLD